MLLYIYKYIIKGVAFHEYSECVIEDQPRMEYTPPVQNGVIEFQWISLEPRDDAREKLHEMAKAQGFEDVPDLGDGKTLYGYRLEYPPYMEAPKYTERILRIDDLVPTESGWYSAENNATYERYSACSELYPAYMMISDKPVPDAYDQLLHNAD